MFKNVGDSRRKLQDVQNREVIDHLESVMHSKDVELIVWHRKRYTSCLLTKERYRGSRHSKHSTLVTTHVNIIT